jgi:structure-specific recognition protein 1
MIAEKYEGKLQKSYEAPLYSIVAKIFNGLAGKRISAPARDFESHHSQKGVKCSVKASEGILFCMERSFMFVPKPAQFIQYDQISLIVLSRIGGAISASRTFDVTIQMRGGGEFAFSNINREEQKPLETFFALKNLKVRNEMIEEGSLLKAALNNEELSSDDDEVVQAVDRGSADEDDESVDEDFEADSESDVAEEYDSAHESSGDDEDAEMKDAESDPEERPKKKSKVTK